MLSKNKKLAFKHLFLDQGKKFQNNSLVKKINLMLPFEMTGGWK
jgi:hypothetical protein